MTDRMMRAGQVRAASFNETDNTVQVCWTTGATVRRMDYREGTYDEELVVSANAVRLDRLNAGAPFLDSHDSYGASSVLGSVVPGTAKIDRGTGIATIKLSRAPGDADAVSKIKDGILRNVSVGYRIHAVDKIDRAGTREVPLWRVTDWEPMEISTVPIPADPGAQVRSSFTPSSVHAQPREDHMRSFESAHEAMVTAIMHRVDSRTVLTERAREYRGLSLQELARESLHEQGIRTRGMAPHQLVAVALEHRSAGMMGTSDFPSVLANVASKTLRQGYEASPQTFRPITRQVTVRDFRPVSRVQLSEAPQLEKVNEHGEFRTGKMSDYAESYSISTYGKILTITRQAIVNDDLSAFTRLPRAFGVAAANLESDLAWAQLLANGAMADGNALFHASHGNLGAGAAISAFSVGEGRLGMSMQTGLDGVTRIACEPAFLVVPKALQTAAEQFRAQIFPTSSSYAVPEGMRSLQIISEPRLDAGVTVNGATYQGSLSAWFLAADIRQIDILELAYLEGAPDGGVTVDIQSGWDVDGVRIRARHDVGAKVIDWRGLWKNPNGS